MKLTAFFVAGAEAQLQVVVVDGIFETGFGAGHGIYVLCHLYSEVMSKTVSDIPDLSKSWDRDRNHNLDPAAVLALSKQKYWWICELGHSWQSTANQRSRQRTGCPYCAGTKVIEGFNDLRSLFPEIAAEWHPAKNENVVPSQVSLKSSKRVWWLCPRQHPYQTPVHYRTGKDQTGCPYCSGRLAIPGETDLVTLRPMLARFWDFKKNHDTDPRTVASQSGKRFWWVCPEGPDHIWNQAPGLNRLGRCPFCSGRRRSVTNNLEATHPDLAREFVIELNTALDLSKLSKGSSERVWWRCPDGDDHIFAARVDHRASSSVGCPHCRKTRLSDINRPEPRFLAATYPELAENWLPELNSGQRFETVFLSKNLYVWRCTEVRTHYWRASFLRAAEEGCPKCAGRFTHFSAATIYEHLPFELSIKNHAPDLAGEWVFEMNGENTPVNTAHNDSRKFWWACAKNREHRFLQSPYQRLGLGNGCPYCSGRLASDSNSLINLFPEIASELHLELNGFVNPKTIAARTSKLFWWKCSLDPEHIWQASPANRCHTANPTGCPHCAQYGFNPGRRSTIYLLKHSDYRSRKIGITHQKSRRLGNWELAGWDVLGTWEDIDGEKALSVEESVLGVIRGVFGLPQFLGPEEMGYLGGWTETFSSEGASDEQIMALVESHISS